MRAATKRNGQRAGRALARITNATTRPSSTGGRIEALIRRLAEARCSEDFIASFTGHDNYDEIRVYTRAARQKKMAQTHNGGAANGLRRVKKRTVANKALGWRPQGETPRVALKLLKTSQKSAAHCAAVQHGSVAPHSGHFAHGNPGT